MYDGATKKTHLFCTALPRLQAPPPPPPPPLRLEADRAERALKPAPLHRDSWLRAPRRRAQRGVLRSRAQVLRRDPRRGLLPRPPFQL